jgi:predicted transcriptional regulator
MPAASRKTPKVTASVKIPAPIKARVAALAQAEGVTAHAWLLRIIEQETERVEKRSEFVTAGRASLEKYLRTGMGHRAKDVFAYLAARRAGKNPPRPKPVKSR